MKTKTSLKPRKPACGKTIVGSSFFKRGNQVWKKKSNGNILLINTKEAGHHYDGDAHLFLNTKQFNQDGATEITEQEWKRIRDAHLSRLRRF